MRTLQKLAAILGLVVAFVAPHRDAEAEDYPIITRGDLVVTQFSGVLDPAFPPPKGSPKLPIDNTFINPLGISARINKVDYPDYVWDGRVWNGETRYEFKARDIGQVFGVTIDRHRDEFDKSFPNIYLAATSFYGLHIVAPDTDNDGRPERLKKGDKVAAWSEGQWGTADTNGQPGSLGGPGSIWKIDGKTREISLFANVMLKGQPNAGAGLGNIKYVREWNQIFATDLSTGMLHRYDMEGREIEVFDHGVTGRTAGKLKPIPYDVKSQLDITKKDFDIEDQETYGMTDVDRRIYGLAYNRADGRLYYYVHGDSQIWSVGFKEITGEIVDPRWELDVPKKPKHLPVTDMLFTNKGAMVLSQRNGLKSVYDYSNFAEAEKARVYRYWLKDPKDTTNPSRWIAEPEEYPIGFNDTTRATMGGVTLDYGYDRFGRMDKGQCEASLWTTGDNLRAGQGDEFQKALLRGGPLLIDGLQGMPSGPVKTKDYLYPWASYMVDVIAANTPTLDKFGKEVPWNDTKYSGWMGDVEAFVTGCGGASGDLVAGSYPGYYGGAGYGWTWPPYIPPGGGGGGGGSCTPGVDCPPPPPKYCAQPKGQFICDDKTGQWYFTLDVNVNNPTSANTVSLTDISATAGAAAGTNFPLSSGVAAIPVGSTLNGQLITLGVCLFDSAAAASGKPFDCCKTSVTVQAPSKVCVKK